MAEVGPEIVRTGAEAFGDVGHMMLLNGADGLSEMLAEALTVGATVLGLARQLVARMNGATGADGDAPAGGAAPRSPGRVRLRD
ncbi:hypothetical protein [Actinacidiphila sp. bgisy160]|uniref:hypothetical protein n=1 Tax=Actinacidiphila sp. bgisy160 TaxID=3413796 RepID=UPI003D751103